MGPVANMGAGGYTLPSALNESSSQSPRYDVAAQPVYVQPIVINVGDHSQVSITVNSPFASMGNQNVIVRNHEGRTPAFQRGEPANGFKTLIAGLMANDAAAVGQGMQQAWERANAQRTFANAAMGGGAAAASQVRDLAKAYRASVNAAMGSGMAAASQVGELAHASRTFATVAFETAACAEATSVTKGYAAQAGQLANASRAFTAATLGAAASAMAGDAARMVRTLSSYAESQQWDPCKTYRPGDQVVEHGNVYQVPCSGGSHRNVEPGTDDSKWLYAGTLDNNRKRYDEQLRERLAEA
jgi:hypothetical protein